MQVRKNVLIQRDICFTPYTSVADALADEAFVGLGPDDIAAVVSDRGSLYELNISGALLFEVLQDGADVAQLAKVLAEHFQVSETAALADASAFIAEFDAVQLLEK